MKRDSSLDSATRTARQRLLTAAGWGFFALGTVGVVVPGLPTVVFWIVAAWLWARSSPRLLHRLVSHPRYGATIAAFLNHGVMSRRDKRASFAGMSLGFVLLLALLRPAWPFAAGIAVLMVATAVWIHRRPEQAPIVQPEPHANGQPD